MEQRRKAILAAVTVSGLLLGSVAMGNSGRPNRAASLAAGADSRTTMRQPIGSSQVYRSPALEILKAAILPLDALPLMQRAIATSPESNASDVPALALLNAPLKTTGYGPILIGMPLDEVPETGLELTPIENSGSGECLYYRIEGQAEPVGLMAIDDRILRIDVWPGSLTKALSGAQIGTTEKQLVEYYGDRLEATPNPITGGKTIVFTPQDPGEDIYRIVFETDARGRVVQYRAGQFPSVTWPEGCF
jgi:hypothetical protein